MKFFIFLLLQVLVLLPFTSYAARAEKSPLAQEAEVSPVTEARRADVVKAYGDLPLYFIENKGQVESRVKFYERAARHATFFTEKGVVLTLTKKGDNDKTSATEAVSLSFVGASERAAITAEDKKGGHVNYFTGNDKSRWRSNVPTYGALTYKDVYKNIDIKFYGNNKNIEHDVIVRPGGDFSEVIFVYRGIKGLKVNEAGALEVSLERGSIIEQRPVIYQEIDGKRVAVDGSYRLLGEKDGAFNYGFTVASYDHTKDLVIDPVLVYSTYLGGSDLDFSRSIAIDNTGAAYVTGQARSTDFPTMLPIQGIFGGGSEDVFVTKIDPTGTAIVYSTYIGGGLSDVGRGISVDGTGQVFIAGQTSSTDFPLVAPIQAANAGGFSDAFVAKIDSAGAAIVYSTYLGGTGDDSASGVANDNTGAVYVAGVTSSVDFPVVNSLQGVFGGGLRDAFVTKIDSAGAVLTYSTYLGGSGSDVAHDIIVDGSDSAYVTGETDSTNFPVATTIQTVNSGGIDAFVTKIDPSGAVYTYSTYLGGVTDDVGMGIAIDSLGAAYVTGNTDSVDFPLVSPVQGAFGGGLKDAFITKIDATGSAINYSTYLGGSASDFANDIAVDISGSATVIGDTFSADFPLLTPISGQGTFGGGLEDAFITKINAAGSAFDYSTYLGGNSEDFGISVALDSSGGTYTTGYTLSTDFPLVTPIQNALGGGGGFADAFISKISNAPLPVVSLLISADATSIAPGLTLGYTVMATNTTAVEQCFEYWENVNIPGGALYPSNGALQRPVRLCLAGGASQTVHKTRGVPLAAPVGAYVFNAYAGIFPIPFRVVVDSAHFNFDTTLVTAPTSAPRTSWRIIESGLIK